MINAFGMKTQEVYKISSNFTMEDRNDETMFSETIPSILLHVSWVTVHGVRSTGRVGRRKARAISMEKVCRLICRMAEKLDRVRMFLSKGTDELLNLRVDRLNIVKAMSHPTVG